MNTSPSPLARRLRLIVFGLAAFLFINYFSLESAIAEEASHATGHGAEEGIPQSVLFQAINFVIYAALLFWLLRKPVRKFFLGRQEAFRQALVKAEARREEAERQKQEIQARLVKLQASSRDSVEQAKREAELLRQRILNEGADISKNMRDEARRTAEFEIQRARNELREELLQQSIALSRKVLSEKILDQDQKRLQGESVDKIQAVNP